MAEHAVVSLVGRLSAALADAKVRYCHWKSNEAIDRSLRAENDLDLLVDRADVTRFFEVASALGFRAVIPPPRKHLPGLVSLYGLDTEAGRFVQVDAHFQLVVGDDMTKNYRLPFESAYLADLDESGPLPVPHPEFEYLLFVVRMVLKHSPWDAQLSYKARLTASEQRELAYLEERIDPGEVERLRARHLPSVSASLLAQCRRTLGRELGPLARAAIARALVRALEGCDRRSPGTDIALKISRRISGRAMRRIPGVDLRKRLVSGGAVVAVVGGDGSGKSTTIDDLVAFFGRHFAVRRLHLGKPAPALTTRLVRPLLRRLPAPVRSGIPPWEAERLTRFPGYTYLCAHLLTARDRYRAHVRARRAAGRGQLAICDRYPLRGLQTMDCSRIALVPGVDTRPIARWMRARERAYYGRIEAPDVVVVMRVDPAVALERRPDQDAEFVRRRAEEIAQRTWVEPFVHVIDAGRSLEDVLSEVRALVWALT